MEKIKKEKDSWGEYIIYVQKCKNYKYEDPEKPKKRPSEIKYRIMYTDLLKNKK